MVPQSVIIYGFGGNILFVNDFAVEKFFIDRDKLKDNNIISYLAERDRARAVENMGDRASGSDNNKLDNGMYMYDYVVVGGDGNEFNSTMYIGYFTSKTFITIIVDHSEVDNIKMEYSAQSKFFWEILNSVKIPIACSNMDKTYRFINSAYMDFVKNANQNYARNM